MIQEERGDKIRTKLGKALKDLNWKALLPFLRAEYPASLFPVLPFFFFLSDALTLEEKNLFSSKQSLIAANRCIKVQDAHYEGNDFLHEISLSALSISDTMFNYPFLWEKSLSIFHST